MDHETKSLARELAVVVGLVLLLHWLGSFGEGFLIGTFDDDGVYTVLGKALASGQGYHSLHLVGSPVQVKYPPGFPWILSLFWSWTGSAAGVLRLVHYVHPVVVSLAAALLWILARGRWKLDWGPAALLMLLPLVLDATIQYAAIPLAEPWFVLGWAAALLAWDLAESATGRRRVLWLGVTGLVIAWTVLVRSQGIVLIPALVAGLWLSRFSWRERITALVAALTPLVAWYLYHRALIVGGPLAELPDEGSYSTWFAGGGIRLARVITFSMLANAWFYVRQLGDYLTSFRLVGTFLMAVALLGSTLAGVLLLRRKPVLALGMLGSLGLILLWPFAQDRLLLSTLPVSGLAAATASAPVAARLSPRGRRWVNLAAILAIVPVLLRQMDIRRDSLTAMVENREPALLSPAYGLLVNSRFIATASHWILANTPPDARIMIDHQSGIFLYTGRRTMPASPSESRFTPSVFRVPGQYLAQHILRDSLSFVIVGLQKPGIMRDLETVQTRCPRVLTWGGVSPSDSRLIFRVTPDPGCLGWLAGP